MRPLSRPTPNYRIAGGSKAAASARPGGTFEGREPAPLRSPSSRRSSLCAHDATDIETRREGAIRTMGRSAGLRDAIRTPAGAAQHRDADLLVAPDQLASASASVVSASSTGARWRWS